MYVLDTDILSLLQRGHPVVEGHVGAHTPVEIAIPFGAKNKASSKASLQFRHGHRGAYGKNNPIPKCDECPREIGPRAAPPLPAAGLLTARPAARAAGPAPASARASQKPAA